MKAQRSLQDFIFRGEALKLYREFIRITRSAPKQSQGELRAEVRREFDAHREVPDRHTQKFLLSDGRTRLKQLSEMLGMQRSAATLEATLPPPPHLPKPILDAKTSKNNEETAT
ncbi:hypothetical protein Ndes2526B_g02549 [Nannochloris sp. 'desiccata']